MKVLIVDGAKDERARLVEAFVRSPDVVVVGAVATVDAALHALAEHPPDAIITDSQIGDGDAGPLLAAARRCIVPPATIVYASTDTADERRRCVDAGADRFVPKPAGLAVLERALIEAFAHRVHGSGTPAERFALIGRVAAGVAHDLNNYLAVMDVSVRMLQERRGTSEDVAMLREALDAAILLNTNVMRYARGSTLPVEPVDLTAVVRRIARVFRRAWPERVRVATELAAVPMFEGNEVEIEQLVLNLVLNAVDASPDDATVRVIVASVGTELVRLEVIDAGPGIAERIVPDPSVAASSKRDGAGLGLGIVRAIARRHAATLRMHEVVPRGTRFVVDFDVQRMSI